MRATLGQAGRACARGARSLVQLAFALALLAGAALALLVWRLDSAPLDSPWLAQQLTALANSRLPVQISIGGAALAWEGFHDGQDAPLDVQLRDLTLHDATGQTMAAIPHARVVLSARWLLRGRVVPWTVALEGASLQVIRQADGSFAWAFGGGTVHAAAPPAKTSITDRLLGLLHPPSATGALPAGDPLGEVRHLSLHHAQLRLDDRFMGVAWDGRDVAIDLDRPETGDPTGKLTGTIAIGSESAELTLQASLGHATGRTNITAGLSPVNPARLAAVLPAAKALAGVDVPVTLAATLQLAGDLQPAALSGRIEVGEGTIAAGTTHVPVRRAAVALYGTPDHMQVKLDRLEIQPAAASLPSILTGQAEIARTGTGGYRSDIALDLDHVTFADLPALWPEGMGGGGRPWVAQNIPSGTLHDGHAELSLDVPPDLSDATLSRFDAVVDGSDVTIWWLRPVPPIEKVEARLTMHGTDSMTIAVSTGRQAGGVKGGLAVPSGKLTISSLTGDEQFADVEVTTAGQIPDVVALLRHPRLHLLDRSPIRLDAARGSIAGKVVVSHLPLRDSVTLDDLQLRATAKLADLLVPGLAAGRDVEHANAMMEATTAGMSLTGTAEVAGVTADLKFAMDFRHGVPTQTVQTVLATATTDERQLRALGLDLDGYLKGPALLTTTYTQLRNGKAEIAVRGDLRKAELTLDKLSYSKPVDEAATLDAHVLLDGGRVTAIDRLRLDGPSVHIDADAGFSGGRPSALRFRKLVLGNDVDVQGDLRLPAKSGDPYVVKLSGRSLDASAPLRRKAGKPEPGPDNGTAPKPPPPPGPPFKVDATLDRLVLADHHAVQGVVLAMDNDGAITRSAHLEGRTGPAGAFRFDIVPHGGQRSLDGRAADAGDLLRAFGIIETMGGGALTVTGRYDDTTADHPLSGTLEVSDYRIRNAPVLARLLQAMTLYGLLEVAQGPGLGFSKAVLPFKLSGDTLELTDARTFSPSIGMTAKGSIDLEHNTASLQGTVVPAYFFNSLLGNVPLIGQVFSPERGGGLLAAQFAVHGDLDNPEVSVNPLSALTPGFLRNIFGDLQPAAPGAPEGRPAPPGRSR